MAKRKKSNVSKGLKRITDVLAVGFGILTILVVLGFSSSYPETTGNNLFGGIILLGLLWLSHKGLNYVIDGFFE